MGSLSGWPHDLVDPQDPEFAQRACSWLLDRLPGEFRASAIAQSPVALAWVLTKIVKADLEVFRQMYATARGELPSVGVSIDDALAALEAIGSAQIRLDREAELVFGALKRASGEVGSSHLE